MLRPLAKSDWTPVRAAHLLNRAGFGGSPAELDRIYQMGLKKAVNHLVDFEQIDADFTPPSFVADGPMQPPFRKIKGLDQEERQKLIRENRRRNGRDLMELRGWWLERMRATPRPLEEKMTLFWHGHFATGVRKVKATYAMYLQNQTFRSHSVGGWKDLIVAVSKDPAMLVYLDGARSTRRSPNENYGRELMELFTLGEGHYSEDDIQAAARAFTGWSLDRPTLSFVERPRAHDPGSKTFMGKTGNFDGDTDAGWLQRLGTGRGEGRGLDCAIFGPGDIEVAHKPNEFLPKADLARAREHLERAIGHFCRGEGP